VTIKLFSPVITAERYERVFFIYINFSSSHNEVSTNNESNNIV